MERAHAKKDTLCLAFIDLRKAYDRVWREPGGATSMLTMQHMCVPV